MKMLIILSSIFSNHTIICAEKRKNIIAYKSIFNESNAICYMTVLLSLFTISAKSGSNQTAFMPKLGDEQLTSDVSMIKVMI